MVEQNHNLYDDSRQDIADMYGSPNDRADYGVRGPLHTVVEIEPVTTASQPEQLDLFSEPSEVQVTVTRNVPVTMRSSDKAVPMPSEIREQLKAMKERVANKPPLKLGNMPRQQADERHYAAHWREQARKTNNHGRGPGR